MGEREDSGRPVRWWPGILIAALSAGVLLFVWSDKDSPDRQLQVMQSILVALITVVLALLWVLFFSRTRGKAKLLALVAAAAAVLAFFGLFRYEGVDGDLVPVFMPRWWSVETQTFGTISATAVRGDFPQYLGAARDGVVSGVRLDRDWTAHPPRRIWRRPMGPGWSGFAVVGDRAVTMEQHGGEERTVCYKLADGAVLWSHSDKTAYTSGLAGDGPRATPTVHRDRVYTMGATGVVNALELASGKRVWSHDAFKEAGSTTPEWGASCSPLVVDDKVVVIAGGKDGKSVVAYAAADGKPMWSGGDDSAGYASPKIATLFGERQVVAFTARAVSGHGLADGKVLWSTEWPTKYPTVSQPVAFAEDRLLVSSGYGIGARGYSFSKAESGDVEVHVLWRSARLKSKFGALIHTGGYVYGLDDGVLTCVDPTNGQRKWKSGQYGHGQMVLVGDLLLVIDEVGDAVLVEVNPEEHKEVARFNVLDNKAWNPPALAGSLLLVRTDKEAALYELATVP